MNVEPYGNGRYVHISASGIDLTLTAQEAYELHERLGAILPKLVQPFQPIAEHEAGRSQPGQNSPTVPR